MIYIYLKFSLLCFMNRSQNSYIYGEGKSGGSSRRIRNQDAKGEIETGAENWAQGENEKMARFGPSRKVG